MAEWRGVELGEDDSTSEVDVELEETHPSDGAFFSSPHGEETNEDGAVDSLMRRASRTASTEDRVSFALNATSPRAPAEATPAAAEEPKYGCRGVGRARWKRKSSVRVVTTLCRE